MAWYEIVIGALIFLVTLAITAFVLLQEGRRAGIAGAIGGGAETFLSKNKSHNRSAQFAKLTKYLSIGYVVLVLISNAISLLK